MFQWHLSQISSSKNVKVPADKSSRHQHLVTQVASTSHTIRSPSSEDTCTASENSETETQGNSFSESSSGCADADKEKNVMEAEQTSDATQCVTNSENAGTEKGSSDHKNSFMKLVYKVKPHESQLPQVESEKKEHSKESGIPKIVLTLTGKGPNKEYSCSNRIRHNRENSSEHFNNKKHKSKKNKRQKPKDREKNKKTVKGDKHKRHLELFGEDSNESCDDNADIPGDPSAVRQHSRIPLLDEQNVYLPTEPRSPGDSLLVQKERDLLPSALGSDSFVSLQEEKGRKRNDSSISLVDESLSSSHVKLDSLKTKETDEKSYKDLPPLGQCKETREGQSESADNKREVSVREVDETQEPDSRDTEALNPDSENTEERSSACMLHSREVSHPSKQHPDSLILRNRKSRHAKKTESGRNSDARLWVSFGVSPPLPLPATEMPCLKRIVSSKEKTKLKESVPAEIKDPFSTDDPSMNVTEKPNLSHKSCNEREKTKAVYEGAKDSRERDLEEKAKLPSGEKDRKHDFTDTYHRSHSSFTHGGSNHIQSRVPINDNFEHHRHRHSHKRSQKYEESQERMAKKHMSSCHQDSWNPTHKDNNESQVESCKSHKERSHACSMQMHCAETFGTNTSSTQPSVFPSVGDDLRVLPKTNEVVPQSMKNVAPNVQINNIDKPKDFTSEEPSDNQYYRPKKIRKVCHISTTRDQWIEKKSLDPTEDRSTQGSKVDDSSPISYKNNNSLMSSHDKIAAPLGLQVTEPDPSTAESDVPVLETGACWKPHEEVTSTEKQPRSPQDADIVREERKPEYRSPSPQGQEPITMTEQNSEEQTHHPTTENEGVPGKSKASFKDSVPECEENEKQEVEKKERRRRSRRERRREYSGR